MPSVFGWNPGFFFIGALGGVFGDGAEVHRSGEEGRGGEAGGRLELVVDGEVELLTSSEMMEGPESLMRAPGMTGDTVVRKERSLSKS